MTDLFREATRLTPEIKLSFESGTMELKGVSIAEDTAGFYHDVVDWFNNYCEKPQKESEVSFSFEYFNTSTSSILLEILKILEKMHTDQKSKVQVKWIYEEEDLDMLEIGRDLGNMVKLPMEFVPVNSIEIVNDW